jgi:hypothetical protein
VKLLPISLAGEGEHAALQFSQVRRGIGCSSHEREAAGRGAVTQSSPSEIFSMLAQLLHK